MTKIIDYIAAFICGCMIAYWKWKDQREWHKQFWEGYEDVYN